MLVFVLRNYVFLIFLFVRIKKFNSVLNKEENVVSGVILFVYYGYKWKIIRLYVWNWNMSKVFFYFFF